MKEEELHRRAAHSDKEKRHGLFTSYVHTALLGNPLSLKTIYIIKSRFIQQFVGIDSCILFQKCKIRFCLFFFHIIYISDEIGTFLYSLVCKRFHIIILYIKYFFILNDLIQIIPYPVTMRKDNDVRFSMFFGKGNLLFLFWI